MKIINEDIKTNTFKSIYLICGSEEYLKKQKKDELIRAITGGDSMNTNIYTDKVNPDELVEMASTLPFFSDKRLIVLNGTDIFSSTNDAFVDLVKAMPDYLHIIIVDTAPDKRKSLYKTISKVGYIAELNRPTDRELSLFLKGKCKGEGYDIEGEAISELIRRTGGNLSMISNELDKLWAYKMQSKNIELKDVEALSSLLLEDRVFDMIAAIASKKKKLAFDLYYDLLALKEAPIKLLILMERHFLAIYQVKEADPSKSYSDLAKEIGLKGVAPFQVKKYKDQTKFFSKDKLKFLLEEFARTEENIKTGLIGDRIGLEIMISMALI